MSPRVPEPQPGVHDTDPIRVPALFGPLRTGLRPDAGIHELRPKTTRSRATVHPAGHQPAQSNNPHTDTPHAGERNTAPTRRHAQSSTLLAGARPSGGIQTRRPRTAWGRALGRPAGHQPVRSTNPNTAEPHAGERNTAPTRTHAQSSTLRAGARPSGGIQTRRPKTAWGRAPGRPAGHQPVRSTNPNTAEPRAGEHSTGPARVPALSGMLRTGTRPDGGIQAVPPGTAA
jgi:hypothetical protein